MRSISDGGLVSGSRIADEFSDDSIDSAYR